MSIHPQFEEERDQLGVYQLWTETVMHNFDIQYAEQRVMTQVVASVVKESKEKMFSWLKRF